MCDDDDDKDDSRCVTFKRVSRVRDCVPPIDDML